MDAFSLPFLETFPKMDMKWPVRLTVLPCKSLETVDRFPGIPIQNDCKEHEVSWPQDTPQVQDLITKQVGCWHANISMFLKKMHYHKSQSKGFHEVANFYAIGMQIHMQHWSVTLHHHMSFTTDIASHLYHQAHSKDLILEIPGQIGRSSWVLHCACHSERCYCLLYQSRNH